MEIPLIFCLCFYLLCRRANNHFDVHFRRIGPVAFLSKDGNRETIPTPKWGNFLMTLANLIAQRQKPTLTLTL